MLNSRWTSHHTARGAKPAFAASERKPSRVILWEFSVCTASPSTKETARPADPRLLTRRADQIHSDAPKRRIVASVVMKPGQIKTGAKLPVGPRQQVFVERRREPNRVIVGGVQDRGVLDEIDAHEQAPAAELPSGVAQKSQGSLGSEIADGRAGKKSDASPRAARHWRQHEGS